MTTEEVRSQREEPIVGNNYLPDGFELLYASSDAGGEFIANQLLQRAAREIAELYRSDDVAKPPVVATSEGGSLSYIRVWEGHGPVA